MNLVGVYLAGNSWLHRLPAWTKVLGLLVIAITALAIRSPFVMLGLLAVALAVLLSSRVDLRVLRRPLIVVGVMGSALALFMWWQVGWHDALLAIARLLTLVLVAWTVSLTTRVADMLAVLLAALRPLRALRVNPEKVAMMIALAIRSVPLLIATVRTSNEARLARGQDRSVVALGVPIIVRSVKIADELGDALIARGYDPDYLA